LKGLALTGRALFPGHARPALNHSQAVPGTFSASTRFVIPEFMAPTTEPTAADIAGTGRKVNISREDAERELRLSHQALSGDDLPLDVLGSEDLAAEVEALLRPYARLSWWRRTLRRVTPLVAHNRVGALDARQLTLWSSDATQLTGMHIRGPSTLQPTMVIKGTFVDTHVDVQMESFPVNAQPVGDPYPFRKMDVAEGGPIIAAGKGRERTRIVGAAVSFLKGFGEQSGSVDAPLNDKRTTGTGTTTGLNPQTGRLPQITQPYQEHRADVIWRITVTSRYKNMLGSIGRRRSERFVQINDGIRFFRPETRRRRPAHPPAGPHSPPPAHSPPRAQPRRRRALSRPNCRGFP
jgi:hypothetical protein